MGTESTRISPSNSPPAERRWRRLARHSGRGLLLSTLLLVVAWPIGQTFRDVNLLTALCFYIPSPVVAAASFGWVAVFLLRSRRRRAAGFFALAAPPLLVILLLENRPFARLPDPEPNTLRLVHWNVSYNLDEKPVRDLLASERAELYAITEQHLARYVDEFRDELGPDFRSAAFGELAVVARGELQDDGWLADHDELKVRKLTWTRADRPAVVFVVDLPSAPWVPRDPLLAEVVGLIAAHRPDLVVGDFNAPRRSHRLTELPDGYRHAFDVVGAGCGYTWPVPAPVYALDQCLFSDRVIPVRYELKTSGWSDHRRQVFDFRW
jgi:vancomycin resistance protein VanJ